MPPSKSWCRALFTSLVVSLCVVSIARAQTARQIAQNTFPSVVLLVMEDANGQPLSLGSGFFVRDSIIATNLHVMEGANRGSAKLVGQKTRYDIAGIVGLDAARDLVILAVTGAKAPSLSLGDSSKVAVGDEVYAVGNPQGLEGTFSQGIVSSVRQVGPDTLLQITAPISPRSSGGPVLNGQGKVIGVAVATFKGGQNLNFAIPVSYLASLLLDIKPVAPLSAKTRPRQEKSILDDLGERNTEGVVAGQLTWDSHIQSGNYSFSLRNQLRQGVTNVYCLVVFYETFGNPIDIDIIQLSGVIPAGLAKRVTSKVDQSVEMLNTPIRSIDLLRSPPPRYPQSRVEVRILDFRIVE